VANYRRIFAHCDKQGVEKAGGTIFKKKKKKGKKKKKATVLGGKK